ncbi:hypothetical protein [Streptomyces sp. NPDC058623]|uniref:hypothetical protein n=1 Tax=Streptomyces sp. NPDC058623 TaxID=3346563 RepID=UPI0036521669
MGVTALKWQGWLVGLVGLAGLLVFAPLGLYVWASGGDRPAAPPPGPAAQDVRVTGCRVDPASRRVVGVVQVTARRDAGAGGYVVTVEFRDREEPGGRAAQALVKIPGVAPGATESGEALGPVWPPATTPWCGVASTEPVPPPTPLPPTPGR